MTTLSNGRITQKPRTVSMDLAEKFFRGETSSYHDTNIGLWRVRGGPFTVMAHKGEAIAVYSPESGVLQVRASADLTIVDRLNAITSIFLGRNMFSWRVLSEARSYASPFVQYYYGHNLIVVPEAVYTIRKFTGATTPSNLALSPTTTSN